MPARLLPSAVLRRALSAARRGGGPLLPLTYVLLGVALVAYVVGMLALAFLAVLVMTLRFLLTPPLTLLGRAPGVRVLVQRRRLRRYARDGVAVLEDQLRASARRSRRERDAA